MLLCLNLYIMYQICFLVLLIDSYLPAPTALDNEPVDDWDLFSLGGGLPIQIIRLGTARFHWLSGCTHR